MITKKIFVVCLQDEPNGRDYKYTKRGGVIPPEGACLVGTEIRLPGNIVRPSEQVKLVFDHSPLLTCSDTNTPHILSCRTSSQSCAAIADHIHITFTRLTLFVNQMRRRAEGPFLLFGNRLTVQYARSSCARDLQPPNMARGKRGGGLC